MADVLIVCVREDEPLAKAFADMFERAGLQVGGAPSAPEDMRACGAALVVWSQASIRSRAFLDAAQRAVNAGKAVVACLIAPPPAASINHAPAFDLTHWAGDPDDPALDPLFFAVDRMVNSARAGGVEQPEYDMAPAEAPAYGGHQQDYPAPAPPYARAQSRAAPAAPPQRAAPVRAPAPAPRPQARPTMDYDAAPPRAPAPPRAAPPPRRPAPQQSWRESDPMAAEAQNWAAIRHSRNPEDFLKHLADFGAEGAFAELAQMRLAELEAETRRHRQTPAAAARQDSMRQEQVRLEPTRPAPRPPMRPAPHRQPPPAPAATVAPRRSAPPMEGLEPTRPTATPRMPRQPSFEPVRSESPPRPRPSEAPIWRDEPRAPPPRPELVRAGGGAGRMIILFLVLGGAALGAGIFAGDRLSVAKLFSGGAESQTASVSSDEWSEDPEGSPPAATARVDEASSRRLPAGELPARDARRPQADRGRGGPLEDAREEPPVPRPRVTPERTTSSTTTSSTASPTATDLDPTASGFGPVQLAAIPAPPSSGGGIAPQTTATASAPPARPPQVLWAERPTAQRIGELFPERAMRSNQVGRVELDCLIDTRGTPRCAVARETPPGFGFGAAAMRATGQFRAAPALDNGAPSTGAQTRLTIVFRGEGGNR